MLETRIKSAVVAAPVEPVVPNDYPNDYGRGESRSWRWGWLGLVAFVALIAFYFLIRYGTHWAEIDSANFTQIIRNFIDEGKLVTSQSNAYNNGYSYQTISAFIVSITGLDVGTLQQIIYPFTSCLVVLVAWLLFREISDSNREATIVTLLLFTQPEFLFVILRSSHEKFTRTLLLICLFWLVRSLKLRVRTDKLAIYIYLFYLCAYGVVASNNLMGASFIFAIVITLGLGWLTYKRHAGLRKQNRYILSRLVYTNLICLGLAYLFTFYAYPPALHDLYVLKLVGERIAALFLEVQAKPNDVYNQVALGWTSLPIYFVLSIANWLVLASSLIIWLRQGWDWLVRGRPPETGVRWLMWLMYGAFAAQGVLSLVVDASGAFNNLQQRLFPTFSIIAVSFTGMWLARWQPRHFKTGLRLGLAGVIFCVAILSVLKATNEPLFSNKWTFYNSNELVAVDWVDRHVRYNNVWTEFDERLQAAFDIERGRSANFNTFTGFIPTKPPRGFLVTHLTRVHSLRLQKPVPLPKDAMLVYDDGQNTFFRLRPQTTFQN